MKGLIFALLLVCGCTGDGLYIYCSNETDCKNQKTQCLRGGFVVEHYRYDVDHNIFGAWIVCK